jgi:hypothetical protein
MFLDHLNGFHRNIDFTMEMEKDSHYPFLTSTYTGDRMGHKVYRKPSPTTPYLNPESHNQPPKHKPFFQLQLWCTESVLCVTRNWST